MEADTLAETIQEKDNEINRLQSLSLNLQLRINFLEEQLMMLDTPFDRSAFIEAKLMLDQRERELSEANKQLAKARETIRQHEKAISKASEREDVLSTELMYANETVERERRAGQELLKQLESLRFDHQSLSQAHSASDTQIGDLARIVSQLQSQLASYSVRNIESEATAASLTSKVVRLQSVEQDLARAEERIAEVETQLEECIHQRNDAAERNLELEGECVRLEDALAQAVALNERRQAEEQMMNESAQWRTIASTSGFGVSGGDLHNNNNNNNKSHFSTSSYLNVHNNNNDHTWTSSSRKQQHNQSGMNLTNISRATTAIGYSSESTRANSSEQRNNNNHNDEFTVAQQYPPLPNNNSNNSRVTSSSSSTSRSSKTPAKFASAAEESPKQKTTILVSTATATDDIDDNNNDLLNNKQNEEDMVLLLEELSKSTACLKERNALLRELGAMLLPQGDDGDEGGDDNDEHSRKVAAAAARLEILHSFDEFADKIKKATILLIQKQNGNKKKENDGHRRAASLEEHNHLLILELQSTRDELEKTRLRCSDLLKQLKAGATSSSSSSTAAINANNNGKTFEVTPSRNPFKHLENIDVRTGRGGRGRL